jgi:hypothetical protein
MVSVAPNNPGSSRRPRWAAATVVLLVLGGTVSMKVPEAPTRTFRVRVTRFVPGEEMEWSDGNFLFKGVRTYNLTPVAPSGTTRFTMREVFTGWMLPMIAGQLPDFGPIFERYALDLKAAAESPA